MKRENSFTGDQRNRESTKDVAMAVVDTSSRRRGIQCFAKTARRKKQTELAKPVLCADDKYPPSERACPQIGAHGAST